MRWAIDLILLAVLALCVVVAALTLILNLAALGIRYMENKKP